MMKESEVQKLIKTIFPDAQVEVVDMTGGSDHFQILVVSNEFKGKPLIDQHRMVQKSLESALNDNRIHAVHIKTETPDSWAKKNPPPNLPPRAGGGREGGDFQILH